MQIPHEEHKQLHLTIFGRLENPFVSGILEAYWEAYESIGLNVFTDYAYLREVWGYHQRMVDSICSGDLEKAATAPWSNTPTCSPTCSTCAANRPTGQLNNWITGQPDNWITR